MCDCEICYQWLSDARNHPKNAYCKNTEHCRCCMNQSPGSCIGCNHHNVPLDDIDAIHRHGSIGLEPTEHDWIVVQRELPNLDLKK